jgi:hypothetical protein
MYILKGSDDGVTLGLTGFLDFVYRALFKRTQRFGNCILFRLQARGWETPYLLGSLEIANLSHWWIRLDSDTSCSLEYRRTDKVQTR